MLDEARRCINSDQRQLLSFLKMVDINPTKVSPLIGLKLCMIKIISFLFLTRLFRKGSRASLASLSEEEPKKPHAKESHHK